MSNDCMTEGSFRIMAKGEYASNDTRATGLNNNDLIVGPTGSGKTRYFIKPNLLQMNESIVVSDTKGNLVREVGPALEAHGYEIVSIDFTNPSAGTGYNPLDFIRIVGPADGARHIGAVAFNVDGVHPHDVASILDMSNICIRAGHHCAQPLLNYLGHRSTCRASVAFYNDKQDIDRLMDALELVGRMFNG